MKSNSFYEKNIEQNEFLIALFILIFLIFVPTPSLISGILVWFVVFIILRQITNRDWQIKNAIEWRKFTSGAV